MPFFLGCADGGTACETQGSLELAKNACSDHPGCNGIYFAALTYASSCFWFGLQMLYIYIYIYSHSSTHVLRRFCNQGSLLKPSSHFNFNI